MGRRKEQGGQVGAVGPQGAAPPGQRRLGAALREAEPRGVGAEERGNRRGAVGLPIAAPLEGRRVGTLTQGERRDSF